MRLTCLASLACLLLATHVPASAQKAGPTDPKAQKTYAEALEKARRPVKADAAYLFRKADKQDGHHCSECILQAMRLYFQSNDVKQLREAAAEVDGLSETATLQGEAHYLLGGALLRIGRQNGKSANFADAHTEMQKVIALETPYRSLAAYADGVALANLHQDEAARASFRAFLETAAPAGLDYKRAERFLNRTDLARARMAPPFSLIAVDGQSLSLDQLAGKVVLIDFWATWCGPCREALPRVQKIAKQFAGQPLVVMSISLDKDEAKWKEFIAKNHMDWVQYRDGGFEGPLATSFGIRAIPSTFTIDADGVLQDEHVGDAAIDGKLKKLVAEARQREERPGRQLASTAP